MAHPNKEKVELRTQQLLVATRSSKELIEDAAVNARLDALIGKIEGFDAKHKAGAEFNPNMDYMPECKTYIKELQAIWKTAGFQPDKKAHPEFEPFVEKTLAQRLQRQAEKTVQAAGGTLGRAAGVVASGASSAASIASDTVTKAGEAGKELYDKSGRKVYGKDEEGRSQFPSDSATAFTPDSAHSAGKTPAAEPKSSAGDPRLSAGGKDRVEAPSDKRPGVVGFQSQQKATPPAKEVQAGLDQRGKKLEELGNKTDKFKREAGNFADAATKIRQEKQKEAEGGFFGLGGLANKAKEMLGGGSSDEKPKEESPKRGPGSRPK